jgi:hypothetical protein
MRIGLLITIGDIPASLPIDASWSLNRGSRQSLTDCSGTASSGGHGAYPDTALRSLDAIHLATGAAVFGAQLTAFVAYDERLLTAAAAAGLPTAAPGR